MRFDRFEIRNYKGIEHAVVDMVPRGANVYTLIGLNESGKTTILEAISRFRSDDEQTEVLFSSDKSASNPSNYVPKHKKSNFSEDIVISATISFEDNELEIYCAEIELSWDIVFDKENLPKQLNISRIFKFDSSDYKKSHTTWDFKVSCKTARQKNYKDRGVSDSLVNPLYKLIAAKIPRIVYFPTFLFSFPDKIILNANTLETPEGAINRLYRAIFQDVGSALDNPIDIDKHIVNRIVSDPSLMERWSNIFLMTPDKQEQVNACLSQMSAHITNTVFGSWGQIFGGDLSGRQILLKVTIEENDDSERLVCMQFFLKDGSSEYKISERSLGFRWFFSFLLFTLYRVYGKGRGNTLFLLDEPASNLHSKAQALLLDSFKKIADGNNAVIYSTHSHYMVSPTWLDQAYIVSNDAVDYTTVDESDKFIRNRQTNIKIKKYRNFVGGNPDKVTYFQPVLDKLDYIPSQLDVVIPTLLFEGKGDYLIAEYVRSVMLNKPKMFGIVPTRGATGIVDIAGLFKGWGVPFKVCLDDDKEGKRSKSDLIDKWCINSNDIFTIGDIVARHKGKALSDVLSNSDLSLVKSHFSIEKEPSKSQINLFFSEMLARGEVVALSDDLIEGVSKILEKGEELVEA